MSQAFGGGLLLVRALQIKICANALAVNPYWPLNHLKSFSVTRMVSVKCRSAVVRSVVFVPN